MRTITLDERQVMELEQIATDKDAQAALKFIRALIEKAKQDEKHRSCDQSARPF
ncbi:hypothetical protein HZA56_13095 [Candidatus Poribacteria bacterium]|nr:hypothetical protein [Candidatus Poribacteria bacterium]